MSLSIVPTSQAREEAADWFARLKKRHVAAADLEAFRIWRKKPGHKEAYDEVDAFWRKSGAVAGHPEIKASVEDALKRSEPRAGRRPGWSIKPALRAMLGLTGAAILLGGGYLATAPRGYTTEVGEQRTLQLSDGSTLMLDTASKVTVAISGKRRELRLVRGQAMFDVAHDPARPFVVVAGDTSITALGTRFDVRREQDGARVTLLRGAVEVRAAAKSGERTWRLSPGQGLSTQQLTPKVASIDTEAATSWTRRQLIFRGVPLGEAVAEVNRYDRAKIELDIGEMAEDRMSGVFDAGDMETFIGAIAEMHDLAIDRSRPGLIRLTRKSEDKPS